MILLREENYWNYSTFSIKNTKVEKEKEEMRNKCNKYKIVTHIVNINLTI